jgi:signal recognition particle subunit SRP54
MAGRILGMGDVVTLYEKAQQEFDAEEMAKQQEKLRKGKFTLTDFRDQMRQVKKLGSMGDIMKMIPGMGALAGNPDMGDADEELRRVEGIINSMTPRERDNPDLIDNNRRRRIAKGCGVEASDVNDLLKQFKMMAGVMQQVAGMSKFQQMRAISQMGQSGMFTNPAAQMSAPKLRSKRGPLDMRAEEEKKKRKKKEAQKQRKKNRKK